MDIYGFFNSKDIAEYLKGMDYEFTLPEAAFIVYQSRYRTMEEKFDAWRELIVKMPDCSMDKRLNMEPIESVHQFLRDYMELQKKVLELFYVANGSLYTYELLERGVWQDWKGKTEFKDDAIHRIELGQFFADAESALTHLEQNLEEYEEEGLERVIFIKQPLLKKPDLEREEQIWLEMTPGMDVISVDAAYKTLEDEDYTLQEQFHGMCFAIPTPFKRGDILIDRSRCGDKMGPFVLENISTWDRETKLKNGYGPQHPWVRHADKGLQNLLKDGDYSDMNYAACYLDTDSEGFPVFFDDNEWTYLNLERYEEPLRGKHKALKVLSSAITYDPQYGASIDPELACNAFQLIVTEQMCKLNRKFYEAFYTEEAQELAGLK